MTFKKRTVLLIAIATLVRCIIAACLNLGNDEVYYRIYAQYLQWNYFDHPPMVGWMIRFTTANLLLDNEFFIRLGAIVSAAISTWLLFLCGKNLNSERTGFLAACTYTATIYGSIIAGTFILPDSPQMVCWTGCLYLLIGITRNTNIDRIKKYNVLWFGLVSGIGMLCKIHTAFLWLGFLMYILFYSRLLLKQPVLYISGAITLLIFLPVIKWNISNHFITYLYHSKRVNVVGSELNFQSFLTFAAGQVFYCNPFIFPLIIISTTAAVKNTFPIDKSQKRFLLLCSLPLIAISTIVSFFKDVLPHWPAPAYSGLILITACYLSDPKFILHLQEQSIPKYLKAGLVLLIVIVICGSLLINYLPGTMGKKENQTLGEGDFTLDMYGWNNIKTSVQKIIQNDERTGLMKKDAVMISNKWFPAAHIDYYIAMPLEKDLIAIGDTSNIHQYAWINSQRRKLSAGDDAYCLVPSENYFDPGQAYLNLFQIILPPTIIEEKRNGKLCRIVYVYRLKNYKGN